MLQSHLIRLLIGGLSAIAPIGQAATSSQDALSAAQTAHTTGDDAKALELYDKVLKEDPKNGLALRESARILWAMWSRPQALTRYEALAAARPLDAAETAEFSNWLVESNQAARALKLVSVMAQKNPKNRDVLLAEARALSAVKRHKDARETAQRVLQMNPKDVDALNLMATSYHWGYAPEFAGIWYERVLAIDPDNFTAQLGMSSLKARSDPEASRRIVDSMVKRHGHNQWIDGVDASLKADPGPTVETGSFERESDGERFNAYFGRMSWGFAGARRLQVIASRAQNRLGPPGTKAGTLQSADAEWETPAGPGRRLSIKGGISNRDYLVGESQMSPVGSARLEWGVSEKLRGDVSAAYDPYVFSLTSSQSAVNVVGASTSITRKFSTGFSATGAVSAAKILVKGGADGSRWGTRFELRRDWYLKGVLPVNATYTFDHFEHPTTVNSPGYFAPKQFSSHTLSAGFAAAVPARLTGRRLTFTISGTYSRLAYGVNDSSIGGTVMAAFHLGNGLEIGGLLVRSNGSLTVGWPAAVSTQLGFGLRFVPPKR